MTDMISIDDRLAALEADNKALRAEVASLKSMQGRTAIPIPPIERGVTISNPTRPVAADLPDDRELKELREICRREFPAWCDSDGYVWAGRGTVTKEQNDTAWLSMFSSSLLAIANMRRLDKPDKKWATTHHVDTASDVLRRIGRPASELRVAPFTMACFCMNVPVSGVGLMGCSVSIGLSEYVGAPIEPGTWRETLKAGRFPNQFPLERRMAAPSPVQIRIG